MSTLSYQQNFAKNAKAKTPGEPQPPAKAEQPVKNDPNTKITRVKAKYGETVKNSQTGMLEGPIVRQENVTPGMTIYEKLDEARATLYDKREYLAYGVHELMQPKITRALPTAGVAGNSHGGVEFFFNPNFLESLTIEELAMVMGHEAMHVLLDHIKVRKENHRLWNICCDVIVNTYLLHDQQFQIGSELRQMLWDAKKIEYPEHQLLHYISAEDLYEELEPQVKRVEKMIEQYCQSQMSNDMGQPNPGQGQGEGKRANKSDKPPETKDGSKQQNDPNSAEAQGKDPSQEQGQSGKGQGEPETYPWQDEEEPSSGATPDEHQGWDSIAEGEGDQIKKTLKNNGTYDRAQKAGKVPAGVARAFESIEQPFNWEKVLEQFVASIIKREDTWERPNRRLVGAWPDVRLPGIKVRHDYRIKVYADMSGSIGPEEVARFVSVLEKRPPEIKISAFSFDTEIYDWKNWDKGEMPRGGGGTSFLQVVRHAEADKEHYDAVVVLTDGYDSEPNPKQPKKWIWVSTAAFPGGDYGSPSTKNAARYKSGFWIKMPEAGKVKRKRR